jgi:hypothetical protein
MSSSLLTDFWAAPSDRPDWTFLQWEHVLGQARQSRLLGRLSAHFSDQGWMPRDNFGPYFHLEAGLRLTDRQQHEVRWEVHCISKALQDISAPVVLLKGAAYLMGNLPPARGRLFSDIDLLVPSEHIHAVECALFAAGWISDERDPYNQRYYRQWMHEIPPLRHVHRNTYIDLHHTITPPTSRFNVNGEALLSRLHPLEGYAGVFLLAPADMVLHSAVHLFTEGEFSAGLRDLLDLKDLLEHFSKQSEFWQNLLDRADELGLQIPLFHALFHIQRLFGYAPPAQWAERVRNLAPPAPARLLMGWLLGLALRPDHPSCNTRWTGLARWLLYVRSHALRMPLYLAIPHLIRKAWMRYFPEKKVEKITAQNP